MDEWVGPENLTERWAAASRGRRKGVKVSLALFGLGLVVWLGGWFVPLHPPSGAWWVVALDWVPFIGFISGGTGCLALISTRTIAVRQTASLDLVTQWAGVVHRLTKAALDEFENELVNVPVLKDNLAASSEDLDDTIDRLIETPPSSTREIVDVIAAVDPRWRGSLLSALREIVTLESTALPKQGYSARLRAAPPEVRRRARWGPALFALALVVIFAATLGMIVSGLFGLHPAWKSPGGLLNGPLGGIVVAWFGAQISSVPDSRRRDRLQAIATSLGTTREQSS